MSPVFGGPMLMIISMGFKDAAFKDSDLPIEGRRQIVFPELLQDMLWLRINGMLLKVSQFILINRQPWC